MKTATQTFNVSFPKPLVQLMDQKASQQFATRSDFLRAAVVQYLKNEQEWEELFRYGQKIGSQAKAKSEEEVAGAITEIRRKSGRWFVD